MINEMHSLFLYKKVNCQIKIFPLCSIEKVNDYYDFLKYIILYFLELH